MPRQKKLCACVLRHSKLSPDSVGSHLFVMRRLRKRDQQMSNPSSSKSHGDALPMNRILSERLARPWTPESWRKYDILQQPEYKDAEELDTTVKKLRALPPLVHPAEVDQLKKALAEVRVARVCCAIEQQSLTHRRALGRQQKASDSCCKEAIVRSGSSTAARSRLKPRLRFYCR